MSREKFVVGRESNLMGCHVSIKKHGENFIANATYQGSHIATIEASSLFESEQIIAKQVRDYVNTIVKEATIERDNEVRKGQTISELIKKLEEYKAIHGDIIVADDYLYPISIDIIPAYRYWGKASGKLENYNYERLSEDFELIDATEYLRIDS